MPPIPRILQISVVLAFVLFSIGRLSSSFNHMAGRLEMSRNQLEKKIFELTLLFETSQKVTHASTTQEILEALLGKALEALQATHGNIMMFNEAENSLVEMLRLGSSDWPDQGSLVVETDAGSAGEAFQRASPITAAKADSEQLFPFGPRHPVWVENPLCLPLNIEGKPIGLLNLFDRKSGIFTSDEIALGGTLASQMALSLEKSRLYDQAVTDGLTKLYVHRYFQLALDNELKRAKRREGALSLLITDIDHFKSFNDLYGHQIGDQVLATVAQEVRRIVRGTDVPARYGGEEFAIILPDTGSPEALGIAERLRKAIEEYPLRIGGKSIRMTVSIGAATFPAHAVAKIDLIKNADRAMYEAKRNGRNRSILYDPGWDSRSGVDKR